MGFLSLAVPSPLSQNLVLTWAECIGPVIGGFVTEYIGWRWTFWIILIFVSQPEAPAPASSPLYGGS